MKTLGNHQIQVGGGWDQVNYTAELRREQLHFPGDGLRPVRPSTQIMGKLKSLHRARSAIRSV
jgi:hypothetical protein